MMLDKIRTLIRRFLHIPLWLKLVSANMIVMTPFALVGVVIAVQHVQASPSGPHYDLLALFVVAGVGIDLVVSFGVIKLILAPWERFEKAVDEAGQGKRPVFPATSLIGDDRLDGLIAAFTNLQDTLEHNEQRASYLAQKVLSTQEEERQRIARELHDETAQILTSVLLYLKLLEKSADPEEVQRLQNLRKLITHALREVRRLVMELHPRMLDEQGLEATLSRHVDELNAAGSMNVTLQVAGCTRERLSKDLELTFYRVAQEALNNTVHHSQAHCAQVILKRDADWLTLEVADDGVGFDQDALPAGQPRGFGLTGMRERLALVGGELAIESEPGAGTRLCARARLSPQRPHGELLSTSR
jgi:two-component system, NarL family, sensor histidine kinase UhpB